MNIHTIMYIHLRQVLSELYFIGILIFHFKRLRCLKDFFLVSLSTDIELQILYLIEIHLSLSHILQGNS